MVPGGNFSNREYELIVAGEAAPQINRYTTSVSANGVHKDRKAL